MPPFLDVSDVLLDPDFADTVTVLRRAQTVDIHGRAVITESSIPNVLGVVTLLDPNKLVRTPEYTQAPRTISFVTKARLYGPAEVPGSGGSVYQPDYIQWEGNTFLVTSVLPYTRYGAGFVEATAEQNDYVSTPTQ